MSNSKPRSVLRRFVRAAFVAVGLVAIATVLIVLSFMFWRWVIVELTNDEAISLLGAVVLSPSTAAAVMAVELNEFAGDLARWISGSTN